MYKSEKEYYLRSFLIASAMAAIIFLPFVIADGGYFLYYSDYNNVQIPVYQHCAEAVRSGMVRWDWQTELGANFVGSYTYYTLGSPFFWFMTLFPPSFTRYLMAPMLCIKFGLVSLFGFMYIRRFTAEPQAALIGGLLYTFSSFSLYSVVFQFQDAFMWFPLMLIALDEAVINKRKGVFALTVAVNCLANYFFFIQEVIFIIIYFFCRLAADKKFRISAGNFFCLAFESIAGVMIAGILFIPSIFQILDIPRATQTVAEWDFMFYSSPKIYGLFLESIFFPGEPPIHSRMFMMTSNLWTNAAAYLPLFSVAGVIAYIKSCKKGHWTRFLLPICLLIYFVPGLNAMFIMFNNTVYARWLYMPVLICCMTTACALEHKEYDWELGYKVCECAVFIMSLLVTLTPFKQIIIDENGEDKSLYLPRFLVGQFGLPGAQALHKLVFINIALALAFIIALRYILASRKKLASEKFMKRVTAASVICSVLLGYYYIGLGISDGLPADEYNEAVRKDFEIDDDEFYRAEFINEMLNVNMLWNENSFENLHNIVPASVFEIQKTIGLSREVLTDVPSSYYAFRALTNVKYLEYKKSYVGENCKEYLLKQGYFRLLESQGDSEMFVSDYALPMGFAYDEYYPIDDIPENCNIDNLMIKAVLLTKEQAEEYSGILEACGKSYAEKLIPTSVEDNSRIFEIFRVDVKERADMGVSDFKINQKGFTARCDYNKDKLVMFSVPYCKGWSASVNGEPVKVDKVSGGFCAIRVPSGASDISFEYLAPGMKYGMIASAAGISVYILYVLSIALISRRRRLEKAQKPEQVLPDGVHDMGEPDKGAKAVNTEENKE